MLKLISASFNRRAIFIAGLTLLLAGMSNAITAHASVIVAPGPAAATEGSSANFFPFSANASDTPMHYQQVYDSTIFGAVSGPQLITEIAFRPDATYGSAFSATLPNIQINMSTTSAAPDALSTTLSNNVGADDAVVYNGSLSLSSSFTGPAIGPKDFDILISLMTPFIYDPSLGNLLLEVWNPIGVATTAFDVEFSTDSVSRAIVTPYFSGGVTDTVGLVTQFTMTAVPEPATLALLGAGLAGLGFSRRKKSA